LKDENGNEVNIIQYDLGSAQFFKDITRGRDLAPAMISWEDENGEVHNVFERKEIRRGFTSTLTFKSNGVDKELEVPINYYNKSEEFLKEFLESLGNINITDIHIEKNK